MHCAKRPLWASVFAITGCVISEHGSNRPRCSHVTHEAGVRGEAKDLKGKQLFTTWATQWVPMPPAQPPTILGEQRAA